MKATITQSVPQETSIQLEEKFSQLSDTSYCVDLVSGGKIFARHLTEQQMLDSKMRLVNKLQTPAEPAEYKSAKALDTTGWQTRTADFGGYVDLSALTAPATAGEVAKA